MGYRGNRILDKGEFSPFFFGECGGGILQN